MSSQGDIFEYYPIYRRDKRDKAQWMKSSVQLEKFSVPGIVNEEIITYVNVL